MKNNYGPKIKAYLAEHGIKIAFLAQKVGMKQPNFTALLAGNKKMFVEEYFAICEALNVPIETFYEKKEV